MGVSCNKHPANQWINIKPRESQQFLLFSLALTILRVPASGNNGGNNGFIWLHNLPRTYHVPHHDLNKKNLGNNYVFQIICHLGYNSFSSESGNESHVSNVSFLCVCVRVIPQGRSPIFSVESREIHQSLDWLKREDLHRKHQVFPWFFLW